MGTTWGCCTGVPGMGLGLSGGQGAVPTSQHSLPKELLSFSCRFGLKWPGLLIGLITKKHAVLSAEVML